MDMKNMKPFTFSRAANPSDAVKSLIKNKESKFIAGGTNLIDLMKEGVEQVSGLVDISRLPLSTIQPTKTGGVMIGALAKNTDTANHPLIRQQFPLLSQAILSGASAQIRNMATNGGNLMQRTRCMYFYDVATPCNKRETGSGCGAAEGLNKYSAVLGASDKCVATNPSDMCVALAALDAKVHTVGIDNKKRIIPFADFHRLPGDNPAKDNTLADGELITAIELPKSTFGANSYYLKVRDRASYAFALVSVAAAINVKAGKITQARIALGGVAHKPWRSLEAEKSLVGKPANDAALKQTAEIALRGAKPLSQNGYKVTMAKRAIVRALAKAVKGGKA
jgi:xanthine dehydrogenase YagS FAD-binding subunit